MLDESRCNSILQLDCFHTAFCKHCSLYEHTVEEGVYRLLNCCEQHVAEASLADT